MRVGAIALILLTSPLLGQATGRCSVDWHQAPPVDVQPGDLVFRRGHGFWTKFFIDSSTREKRFSHVGIVVSNVSGEIKILHSEADDFTGIGGVQFQNWRGFYQASSECAVFRYEGPAEDVARYVRTAQEKLGVPFDSAFDMTDTNRLYCTELIRVAVNAAVKTNLIGCTQFRPGYNIIAIDDIYKTGFKRIFDSEAR